MQQQFKEPDIPSNTTQIKTTAIQLHLLLLLL